MESRHGLEQVDHTDHIDTMHGCGCAGIGVGAGVGGGCVCMILFLKYTN